jgi:predicted transcriptional regulator with HTH domain
MPEFNLFLEPAKSYDLRHQHYYRLYRHYPEASSLSNYERRRSKRSPSDPGGRSGSSAEWPPKSKENWVEILVVADGPMVKYHGDGLRQYVLTLMNIVRHSAYYFI